MEITFLGTGGGRYATGLQTRKTGGIILRSEETQVHIDPGPGGLVNCHEYLDNPLDTEAILVSHAHLDHAGDAEAIIEMMTEASDKPGAVFAPESVLQGFSDLEKKVSDYHKELCAEVRELEHKSKFEFKDLKIESQNMVHGDPKTQGLKISDGKKTFGFWTDSGYSEELARFYKECETIIIYCALKKEGEKARNYTNLGQVPKIAKISNADNLIITHFGQAFLNSDIQEQENWLKDQVDAKVVFAEDGMTYPGNRSLESF
jgi:ribonuclease BN (tRNA processing enzyme)